MGPTRNDIIATTLAQAKKAIFETIETQFSLLLQAKSIEIDKLTYRLKKEELKNDMIDNLEAETRSLKYSLHIEELKSRNSEMARNAWARSSEILEKGVKNLKGGLLLDVKIKEELQTELQSKANGYKTLEEDYAKLRNAHDQLQSQYSKLQERVETGEMEMRELAVRYAELEGKLESRKRKLDALKEVMESDELENAPIRAKREH